MALFKGKEAPPEINSQNISLFGDDDENAFTQSVDAGHKVDPRAQKVFGLCVALAVLYCVGLVIPKDLLNPGYLLTLQNGYTPAVFVSELQTNIGYLVSAISGQATSEASIELSLMIRYVVIALAGAGLALCGAVYQGAFRNALVSPSTLGVMSGASLGLMVWVVFFVDENGNMAQVLTGAQEGGISSLTNPIAYLWDSYSLALCSFIGCFFVVALVLLTMRLAGRGAKASPIMMIITGQVIGGMVGAVGTTVRYYFVSLDAYSAKAQMLTQLAISSFYRPFTWLDIVAIGIPLLITFLIIMRMRQRLMVLALDEAEVRTMGIDARRLQFGMVAICTVLTAIIVAFCGTVGFVGFLVPHLARRLVGPNFKYLLPASTVLGAVFVLGAYVLLQVTIGNDYETMVGMFISIGGAAVFLATALRGKGGARGDFK